MPISTMRRAVPLGFAAVCLALALGCRGESPASAPGSAGGEDRDLPGVETRDFTPREKHEFSRYVSEFAAPCASIAVPLAECILQKRGCTTCLPAAQLIAKAVHEGMAREQVEGIYKQRFDPSSVKLIPIDGSPSRGPATAKATLVEFADFECPFCQRIAPDLDAAWTKRKEDVRFVFKFMPLAMHSHGEIAARAAIAAQAQGKFWEMHHQLFASGGRLEQSDLDGYAKDLGLDVGRFRDDMRTPQTQQRLEADRKLADSIGVKGTPTVYVDGREVDLKSDVGEWLDVAVSAGSGVDRSR